MEISAGALGRATNYGCVANECRLWPGPNFSPSLALQSAGEDTKHRPEKTANEGTLRSA